MNKQQVPFDITQVQNDIEHQLAEMPPISPIDYAPTKIRAQSMKPTTVEHKTEVPAYLPETENFSAVAVASQYEEAAKQVELMGEALREAARRAEAMAAKVTEALKYVEETAALYRKEASLIFTRIENVEKLSDAVIEVCGELKGRIEG